MLPRCTPPGAGGAFGAFATVEDGPCVVLAVEGKAVSEEVRGLFLRDDGAGCCGWVPDGVVTTAPITSLTLFHNSHLLLISPLLFTNH